MTRQPRSKARARLLRSLYIWHRYLGLAAAAFVVVLAATGLLLNHTEELGLDSINIASPALLDWYGVHAPEQLLVYRAGAHAVCAAQDRIFLDQVRLPGTQGPLQGAVEFAGLVVVATGSQLLLLEPAGTLVERLDAASGIPADIRAIGVSDRDELALRTTGGSFLTDADFLAWRPAGNAAVRWAAPTQPTAAERTALNHAWRGDGLTLERIMLDLHSGRILGSGGIYLMDGAAILFLLLAVSGIWLWGKRLVSARAHRSGGRHPDPDGN
ncbi:MAG: PepSY domain-containing protein [Pseudomonadota bacterium]